MIAPLGFDVAAFLPRQQYADVGDMGRSVMGANVEQMALDQRSTEALLRQKAMREQLAFDRDQLLEQARQADMQEFGLNARQQADLEQEMAIERAKQMKAQRDLEAGMVGDAASAFGVGDQTRLEAIKAQASRQAPGLKFTLPGQAMFSSGLGDNGVFGMSAAFDEPAPSRGLNISQGGQELFSGNAADAIKRQQDVARAALMPLEGEEGGVMDPYIVGALESAGRGGVSGQKAVDTALKAGQTAAKLRRSGLNAQQMAISRNAGQDLRAGQAERDQLQDIGRLADDAAKGVEASVGLKALRESVNQTSAIQGQLASGDAWSQNMAGLQLMKGVIKGAASDYDARQMHEAAGFLNSLEKKLDGYLNGGQLPPDMKAQMDRGLQLINSSHQAQIAAHGNEAMDEVYRKPAIIAQLQTPEQAAYFALQAYHNVTGLEVKPGDVEEEAKRIAPLFWEMKKRFPTAPALGSAGASMGGGGGSSIRLGGQLATPGAMGGLGGLGSAPLPPKPKAKKPAGQMDVGDIKMGGKDDRAALELLRGGGGGR